MRLTDKRFLNDGFYEPKSKEERLEIQFMDKPSYRDIYKKLGEYENTKQGNSIQIGICRNSK